MKRKMKIFKIERVDHVDWDEYEGAVVIANTEKEVIDLAMTEMNSDGVDWRDKKVAKVELIGEATNATEIQFVLVSYKG